jgi:hypothetical protein
LRSVAPLEDGQSFQSVSEVLISVLEKQVVAEMDMRLVAVIK